MAGQYPVFVVKREGDATKRLRIFLDAQQTVEGLYLSGHWDKYLF